MIPAYELVEMRDAFVCCGGADTYRMKNRAVTMAHFRRGKEPAVRDIRPDVVAVPYPACPIPFRHGLGDPISVKHVAVHLDEAHREADEALGVRAA